MVFFIRFSEIGYKPIPAPVRRLQMCVHVFVDTHMGYM
jgi:hypothetical protein